jgi:hypothetical protein
VWPECLDDLGRARCFELPRRSHGDDTDNQTVGGDWVPGDALNCSHTKASTSTEAETLVLGRNCGLTHLLQGLLAAGTAMGSGLIALIGFASRRR